MPRKNWWYVDTWVDPKAQIGKIATESQYAAGTPKISFYARTVLLRPVLKDLEEGLHSLIQENTCTCGLKVESKRLMAIVDSPHHRNHTTLEPDPNPQFRGLVGRRLHMPMQDLNKISAVDLKWDRIVKQLKKRARTNA